MPDGTIFLRIFPLWRQVHDAKHYAHCSANQMLLSSVTAQLVCMQVRFINAAAPHIGTEAAYAHGAHLVLLDGIGLGVGMPIQVSPSACMLSFLLLPSWSVHPVASCTLG